jgi:hypothetical protein
MGKRLSAQRFAAGTARFGRLEAERTVEWRKAKMFN